MNHIDLKGRCAVVTGGAAGIGLAIAQRFAASGARVAIWDLDGRAAAAAAAALGDGHLGLAVDVADEPPAAVKTAIFDQITQQHIDFMLSKIPMARFGGVEEIAAMVAWLASEDCSFSTGAVFDLSGGRAVY
jgi:NAD(P)-dependent dehydrogenase (short-subunit alcohol dehydrogenase family)